MNKNSSAKHPLEWLFIGKREYCQLFLQEKCLRAWFSGYCSKTWLKRSMFPCFFNNTVRLIYTFRQNTLSKLIIINNYSHLHSWHRDCCISNTIIKRNMGIIWSTFPVGLSCLGSSQPQPLPATRHMQPQYQPLVHLMIHLHPACISTIAFIIRMIPRHLHVDYQTTWALQQIRLPILAGAWTLKKASLIARSSRAISGSMAWEAWMADLL